MSRVLAMKYGSQDFPLTFKKETHWLKHHEPRPGVNADSLRQLLASRLLSGGSGFKNVGIVVADKTRVCEYPVYLPVITELLLEAGIIPSNITFYIAYGTHARQSDSECLACYGEVYEQFNFIHHDSKAVGGFQTLGTTSRGTRVRIARQVLDHDLLITFGAILHHYFAGYGGGRKLLFPGLADYDSILGNHRLFLDFNSRCTSPGCRSGQLDDNPLALDLEEINGMLPPRLEIHAVLNSRKQVCELYPGNNYEDFRMVCQRYDEFFRSGEVQKYDLLVASAGGHPKDINFIQAHKSIHNAASFVKDGGKLVIFAECPEGIGNPEFMDIFRLGGREKIFEQLEGAYRNNAGTALSMLEKSERIHIQIITSLSDETCELMGASRCPADKVQEMVDAEPGSVAVLENAGLLYR